MFRILRRRLKRRKNSFFQTLEERKATRLGGLLDLEGGAVRIFWAVSLMFYNGGRVKGVAKPAVPCSILTFVF
jgi:hypothetical protein